MSAFTVPAFGACPSRAATQPIDPAVCREEARSRRRAMRRYALLYRECGATSFLFQAIEDRDWSIFWQHKATA